MQKRRHLEASFQQTDPGCSSDSQPHAFLISGPASPEQYDAFVKFTHDQIMRRYGEQPASYVS
ncbi:hypothetical protein A6R68_07332 [Neotoma lepida]|uniref:Akirin-2 n=1 Tax=Neotoma lepida TaxID=56216 RepID=A0A1A6GD32_NEOLE|nr:hypothetical protein A6R68_07332 [Neotoma lepida]